MENESQQLRLIFPALWFLSRYTPASFAMKWGGAHVPVPLSVATGLALTSDQPEASMGAFFSGASSTPAIYHGRTRFVELLGSE